MRSCSVSMPLPVNQYRAASLHGACSAAGYGPAHSGGHALGLTGGKREIKRAANAYCALHPDSAAVRFHDSLGDRKAQTNPAPIGSAGLPEATEDVRELRGKNAGTRIRDGDEHFLFSMLAANPDVTALFGKFHGVPNQVRD